MFLVPKILIIDGFLDFSILQVLLDPLAHGALDRMLGKNVLQSVQNDKIFNGI